MPLKRQRRHISFLKTKITNNQLAVVSIARKTSEEDFRDELVQKFQNTIWKIKTDREMGERYMTFEELLREEKQDGKLEGKLEAKQEDILELLEDLGRISDELQTQIEKLDSLENLKVVHKLAARADSLCAFEEAAAPYFISEDEDNE